MRKLILPALLIGAAACVRDPDPFEFVEPSLSVHGLVIAGETEINVSILPGHGVVGSPTSVRLTTGASELELEPTSRDSTCYSYGPVNESVVSCFTGTVPGAVTSGSSWELHAVTSTGDVVRGTTRVPFAPTIVSPAHRQRFSYVEPSFEGGRTQLDVEWQTAGAPRVEFDVQEGYAYRGGARLNDVRCMPWGPGTDAAVGQPSGTRRLVLHEVYCASPTVSPVQWDSVVIPVVVTAFDSAYAEFALHGESVIQHRGASLTGAYGVFGSAAVARREVVIVR